MAIERSVLQKGFYVCVDGQLCTHDVTLAAAERQMAIVQDILPRKSVYVVEVLPRLMSTPEGVRKL